MNLSVQGYPVMGGHAVLGHIERFLVTLIEEFRSPVENFRSHRPLDGGLREARITVHTDRIAVFICPYRYGVVHVLSVEIQRLGNQLQILLRIFREILAEALHDILRILA